jgi:hypothetical protein
MAINKNHEFEELDGEKCGIVEKNVSPERVGFLKNLLEFNHYTVVVVPSPPPKAAPVAKPAEARPDDTVGRGEATLPPPTPAAPTTFTIGVTDYTFNSTNAIFGRLLKTPEGFIVTQAYWLQQEPSGKDDVPYYERT